MLDKLVHVAIHLLKGLNLLSEKLLLLEYILLHIVEEDIFGLTPFFSNDLERSHEVGHGA